MLAQSSLDVRLQICIAPRPEVLSASAADKGVYNGRDRASDKLQWTATPVDLIFGSNAELRAVAEVYAGNNANDKFVKEFVSA